MQNGIIYKNNKINLISFDFQNNTFPKATKNVE